MFLDTARVLHCISRLNQGVIETHAVCVEMISLMFQNGNDQLIGSFEFTFGSTQDDLPAKKNQEANAKEGKMYRKCMTLT